MALILPKGIVRNSPSIEHNIYDISDQLDVADIANFWKVYTTTRRRLLDPTAERLEHFWWRIWGSSRKELRATTIAGLFAQISDGASFVPLRGPPNRDEGEPTMTTISRRTPAASSTSNIHRSNRPSTSITARNPVVMPHPILKKTRGPSRNGERPTARFISPHESENEPTPTVSPNSHVVVQPPSPDPKAEKRASSGASGKRLQAVIASSSKKKRPVILRRKSSSNDGGPPSPTMPENRTPKLATQSKFLENFSPAQSSSRKGKALDPPAEVSLPPASEPQQRKGKREVSPRKATQSRGSSRSREFKSRQNSKSRENSKSRGDSQTRNREASEGRQESRRSAAAPSSEAPAFPQESKSAADPSVSRATAGGELEMSGFEPEMSSPTKLDKGKGRATGDDDISGSFAKRPMVPISGTPVTGPASVPSALAKSKSQLTLLLEKDRKSSNENKPRG